MHDMDIPGGQNFEARKFKFRTRKCFGWEGVAWLASLNVTWILPRYKHPQHLRLRFRWCGLTIVYTCAFTVHY